MEELFIKQAKQYSETRPTYPEEMFQFIVSKTPSHDFVWDMGTGSGQASKSLSRIYKNVIATDTSPKQLEFTPILLNVQYRCTPSIMSMAELEQDIAAQLTVDLVTMAQTLHWFDLPTFYGQVNHVLKKPKGVMVVWCYIMPEVNDTVDSVSKSIYTTSNPYCDPARQMVEDKYQTVAFPFKPVDGFEYTWLFEFKTERLMKLKEYFTYIRSGSAYNMAKEKGVELLRDEVIEDFRCGWSKDGNDEKIVNFLVHLRIGKVGN